MENKCQICGKEKEFGGGYHFEHKFAYCSKCYHNIFARAVLTALTFISVDLNLFEEFNKLEEAYWKRYGHLIDEK